MNPKERELLGKWYNGDLLPEEYMKLMKETKELLAQPEQEPVAWITEWVQRYRHDDTPIIDRAVSFTKADAPAVPNPNYIPLYITPRNSEKHLEKGMSKEKELLKECRLMLDNPINGTAGRNLQIRITELLAQPEKEPVAWMWTRKYGDGGYTDKVFQFLCDAEEYAKDSANLKTPDIITPLYTAPPTRKPLSDEDLVVMCEIEKFVYLISKQLFNIVARRIEKAHGIGEVE